MKKTEYISFRTDLATKEVLAKVASEKKWSMSLLVEDIVLQWVERQDKTGTEPEKGQL